MALGLREAVARARAAAADQDRLRKTLVVQEAAADQDPLLKALVVQEAVADQDLRPLWSFAQRLMIAAAASVARVCRGAASAALGSRA